MGEGEEVKHKWEFEDGEFYMRCISNDKRFKTGWEWHESGGICIYCGGRAKDECKRRKEEMRKRNEEWNRRRNRKENRELNEWGVQ